MTNWEQIATDLAHIVNEFDDAIVEYGSQEDIMRMRAALAAFEAAKAEGGAA